MILFKIILFILITPLLCKADYVCNTDGWLVNRSEDKVIYTSNKGIIGYEDLACVVGIEFFDAVDNFPETKSIGVVNSTFTSIRLIKWDLKEEFFLIIVGDIPDHHLQWSGYYYTYPDPLNRLGDIIASRSFPKESEVSILSRKKFSINNFNLTLDSIKEIVIK